MIATYVDLSGILYHNQQTPQRSYSKFICSEDLKNRYRHSEIVSCLFSESFVVSL